eukprot:982390-Rhodomonas_salina.1
MRREKGGERGEEREASLRREKGGGREGGARSEEREGSGEEGREEGGGRREEGGEGADRAKDWALRAAFKSTLIVLFQCLPWQPQSYLRHASRRR